MRSIAILNLKGGVGKTVTAVNMAAILAADHRKRVLLVDCDSQCNASDFFGACTDNADCNTLAEFLTLPDGDYSDIIQNTDYERLDIIAASDGLMDLDVDKIASGDVEGKALRDLCDALAEDDAYDFVIFDCPPAFSAASAAALLAAEEVVIPIKIDAFALAGMRNLLCQIRNMQRINPRLRVTGLLPTMWKPTADNVEALRQLILYVYPTKIFNARIRRTDKVPAMTFDRRPITEYSPKSAAAVDYRRFVRELLAEEAQ